MSTLNVDKVDPSTGTALEIGSSGDTISVPSGATLDISASTLTPPATLPASSGVNLTALNATNLGSGTVPTARLGTGTASSSTVLYGDQTYKAEPGGGKILQVVNTVYSTATSTTSTSSTTNTDTGATAQITTSAANSKVLCIVSQFGGLEKNAGDEEAGIGVKLLIDVDSAGFSDLDTFVHYWGYGVAVADAHMWRMGTYTYSHLTSAYPSGTVLDYKTQYKLYNITGASCTAWAQNGTEGPTTFTLFEVGA